MKIYRKFLGKLRNRRQRLRGRFHRSRCHFDKIVAITGSAGKSSTSRLVGAILKTRGPTLVGFVANDADGIIRSFRQRDKPFRYWVQEIAVGSNAPIQEALDFVRPDIGIVTCVQSDHIRSFGSLDKIAETKGKLVRSLSRSGIAILNADDPRVLAMADGIEVRTVTYGFNEKADIRATKVRSSLDGGLLLTGYDGNNAFEIRARFVSDRWSQSVLAALACGRAMGISLDECAKAIESVEPELFKDSLHQAGGVTFVMDCLKAAHWTIPSSLETVAQSTAARKFVVFGTISDYQGTSRTKYQEAARAALSISDRVFFYGKQSSRVRHIAPDFPGRLFMYDRFEALLDELRHTLLPGDLVYVKSSTADHLERIWYAFEDGMSCFRDGCGNIGPCSQCELLRSTQ